MADVGGTQYLLPEPHKDKVSLTFTPLYVHVYLTTAQVTGHHFESKHFEVKSHENNN